MIRKWIQQIRERFCSHEFDMADLKTTQSIHFHERVLWPCYKCGKVFKAHCGLDISPKHGYIMRNTN